jgi:hypothetical protein
MLKSRKAKPSVNIVPPPIFAELERIGETQFSFRSEDNGGFEYLAYWRMGNFKLRVKLHCDGTYQNQSHYVCELLSTTLGWTNLATLCAEKAFSQEYHLRHQGNHAVSNAQQDEMKLLRMAAELLEGMK